MVGIIGFTLIFAISLIPMAYIIGRDKRDPEEHSIIVSEWKHSRNSPQSAHPLDDTISALKQHNEELRQESSKLEEIARLEEENKRLVAAGEKLSEAAKGFGSTVDEIDERMSEAPVFNDVNEELMAYEDLTRHPLNMVRQKFDRLGIHSSRETLRRIEMAKEGAIKDETYKQIHTKNY